MNTQKFEAPKEVVDLINKAGESFQSSGAIVINDEQGYNFAADVLKDYKRQAKELTEKRMTLTKPLDATKKGIMDLFREPLDFLDKAEKTVKAGMITYHNKIEAERKAEEDRLAKIAEKERIYQENLAKKRLETAKKKGDEERIEQIEEEIEVIQTTTVAPVLATPKPTAQGVHTTTTWSGRVTDKMALIKAVAAGQAPVTLLDVSQTTLNAMARALKGDMGFPGVEAVPSTNIVSRWN